MKVKYLYHPEVGYVKLLGKRSIVVSSKSIYSIESNHYIGSSFTECFEPAFISEYIRVLYKIRELICVDSERALYMYSAITNNYYSFCNETCCMVKQARIGYFCTTCEVMVRSNANIRTSRTAMLRMLKICSSLIELNFKINTNVLL